MGIFNQFGPQPANQPIQQMNPQQAQQAFQNDLASLKADPIGYARAHGKNLPGNITDPNQMIQHLLKSTQITNPRYQAAVQLLSRFIGR